jgi:hypothetical protein
VTGGRRPAAPGGSPGSGAARRRGQRAGAGAHIIELGTIRHADAILDLLAARRLAWPAARRDPATAVLSVLAADVDDSAGAPARTAGPVPVPVSAAAVAYRGVRSGGARPGGWARPVTTAAAIVGTLAAIVLGVLAAVSGLMAASMIARLVRFGTSMPAGGAGRAARSPRHVRPGRAAAGRNRRRH